MTYNKFCSWPEAMMISDTLQSKKIYPVVIPIDYTKAEIFINEKDIETAKTICDGWRANK